MKPATKAILLIVGVVVLYCAALTFGFMRDDSADADTDPNEKRPGIEMLGRWTMPFAPRYETRNLRCHGRLLARGPKLSADSTECMIDIDPRFPEDEDYRVLVLDYEPEPAETALAAYVRAVYEEEDNPHAKRDPERCLFAAEMDDHEFRLEVAYNEAEDLEDGQWVCWLKQLAGMSLRITVMREEVQPLSPLPKLALRCIGCDADSPRAITLRAEDEE